MNKKQIDNIFNPKKKSKALVEYEAKKKAEHIHMQKLTADAESKGLAYCPKCGSTSLTTTNKKISIGKGIVGAVVGTAINPIGSAVGAAAGAVSSKKMYCVCMKCGYRWKL